MLPARLIGFLARWKVKRRALPRHRPIVTPVENALFPSPWPGSGGRRIFHALLDLPFHDGRQYRVSRSFAFLVEFVQTLPLGAALRQRGLNPCHKHDGNHYLANPDLHESTPS
jgi:hypothetical protein